MHTKEPWKFSPWHIEEDAAAVRAPEGWIICQTSSDDNAQRIVAAVNATAGIPTPALEAGLLAEAIEALRECADYFDDRADAEYFTDIPTPVPNEEMRLLSIVDAILSQLPEAEND